ncbi:MAG: PQQ-binding-like beta-propeller repeat protein [Chloroflexota bacterium]|nr:PQQ-binding-like beta-propeller repeat protein [Chloroflexota bacterium]
MFRIKRYTAAKAIIIAIVLMSLLLSGCIGPRGWPGGVVEGDTVYVGSMDGKVHALNLEGGIRWSWEPPVETSSGILSCASGGQFSAGMVYAPPVVTDDIIYVASYSGKVYAINAGSRVDVWSEPYDTKSNIAGGVAVADGTLFVGCSDGTLHAVDVATGMLKEGFPFQAEDKIWSTPVVEDGVVYVGSLDHKLYAVDMYTGELKWNEPFEAGGGIVAPPLIVEGVVYVGSFDSSFYAVNAGDGEQKWVYDAPRDWVWAEAVYGNGTIYFGSMDSSVYAVDAGNGTQKWSKPISGPVSSAPVIAGDVLVVASENGTVYWLDLDAGEEKWRSLSVDSKVLAPLSASGNEVYLNAQDNKFYKFDATTGQQEWRVLLSE